MTFNTQSVNHSCTKSLRESFKILSARLFMNHIKERLSREIASIRSPYRLVGKHRILIINHNRLLTPRPSRSLRQQLRLAALVHTHKPKHGLVDRLPQRKQSVVLQQRGLGRPDRPRNVLALLGRQHDAVERLVQRVVVVERARVLRDGVQLAAERAEGTAVDGVAVAGGVDVRAGLVDGRVDHEGGGVEGAVLAALEDVAFFADADQIRGFDEPEGRAEGVDPEGVRLDGVAVGDVSLGGCVSTLVRGK